MSRRQRRRHTGEEGWAGELPVERRGQPGLGGTQTAPEQEGGSGHSEAGVSWEETLLSFYRLWEDVRQVVPPQSAPKGAHRWAPLRVHLARLRQKVLQIRRADASLPHTHGREALQLSTVWQVLHQEWPPDQTCPTTRRLPSQHAPGLKCGQKTPLLRVHVLFWLWRPKPRWGVRHTRNTVHICIHKGTCNRYKGLNKHRHTLMCKGVCILTQIPWDQSTQPVRPLLKKSSMHVTLCNSKQKHTSEPECNQTRTRPLLFPQVVGIYWGLIRVCHTGSTCFANCN